MSEFTEGYFLKSNENEDAIQLLKRANLEGYIFPERNGWVAFVADTSPLFELSEKLKAANKGLLIHFVNAEDHGWGFELCVNNELVCEFHLAFNDEVDTEEFFNISRNTQKDGFEKLQKEDSGKYEMLKKYFDENTEAKHIENAHNFTKDMELYFSDWISYHYVDSEDGEFERYGDYVNLKLIKVN